MTASRHPPAQIRVSLACSSTHEHQPRFLRAWYRPMLVLPNKGLSAILNGVGVLKHAQHKHPDAMDIRSFFWGRPNIPTTSPRHPRNIPGTSPEHPRNIPRTHKHAQNIPGASPKRANIPRTSPEHPQNTPATSPQHPHKIPVTSPKIPEHPQTTSATVPEYGHRVFPCSVGGTRVVVPGRCVGHVRVTLDVPPHLTSEVACAPRS
jgi:hypothetical protein